jgi:uncharacterized Zn finger protein
MWYSYSFESDQSVFSRCQLCGTVTALDVIGVCSACFSHVVRYSLGGDRSVFSRCQLCGTVTSLDVMAAYFFPIAIFLLLPLELTCFEAQTLNSYHFFGAQ